MIDLKKTVKEARERVEAAAAERLKQQQEAARLHIELEKKERWKKIEPHVKQIQEFMENQSSKGFRNFRYNLKDDCPDFQGVHYAFTLKKDSTTDLLIRYLQDAGLTVTAYWHDEKNYRCGEDWTSTAKHWLEIRF